MAQRPAEYLTVGGVTYLKSGEAYQDTSTQEWVTNPTELNNLKMAYNAKGADPNPPASANGKPDPGRAPGQPSTEQNIRQGLNQFGANTIQAAQDVGFRGVKDPADPNRKALAGMQDKYGEELRGQGQQEIGRGERNINAEASERAATESAAENAQNVRNLSGAAGGGAAALKRTTAKPNVGQVKQENAALRQTGRDTIEKGEKQFQSAEALRGVNASANAAAADRAKFGVEARSIAAGAPEEDNDLGPNEESPTTGPKEESTDVGPQGESPTPAPVEPATPAAVEPAAAETPEPETPEPETPAGESEPAGEPEPAAEPEPELPPEEEKKVNARVTRALKGTDGGEAEYQSGIEALKKFVDKTDKGEAWAAWAKAANSSWAAKSPINEKPDISVYEGKTDKFTGEEELTVTKDPAALTPSMATGGYTGAGEKLEPAGVVHKGEYVIPKEGVNQATQKPDLNYVKQIVSDYRLKKRTQNIASVVRRPF
jgi:hypothetical protein